MLMRDVYVWACLPGVPFSNQKSKFLFMWIIRCLVCFSATGSALILFYSISLLCCYSCRRKTFAKDTRFMSSSIIWNKESFMWWWYADCVNLFGKGLDVTDVNLYVKVLLSKFKKTLSFLLLPYFGHGKGNQTITNVKFKFKEAPCTVKHEGYALLSLYLSGWIEVWQSDNVLSTFPHLRSIKTHKCSWKSVLQIVKRD